MKKLVLALLVLGLVIDTSVVALAQDDRRDHDWNDEYWHHNHYGYWHGERGYWQYRDHKHEFIRVSPELGGFRARAADKGITFTAQYIAEIWGNPVGGVSSGTVYTGLMTLEGKIDLQKLLGWRGASFSTRWYWLSGQDISAEHVGNIFSASNISGYATIRMNELWLQQNFCGDRISIRVGELGADSEFYVSTYAIVFLNAALSWSPSLFTNTPNGGPVYPMSGPAIQLALTPVTWLNYHGAIFQGNPFAQNVNRYGFRWDLSSSNGYFSIHELTFQLNQESGSRSLPGTFKIGGWFDTAPDPNTNSSQPWNYGLYLVADQMLYRVADLDTALVTDNKNQQAAAAPPTNKGLGMFTHLGLTPQNSSFINFYIDGGLTYKGLIPSRNNDVLGVAVAYGHLSHNALNNVGASNPGYEIVLETTYQIELATWLSLQPDVQYVIHPSGTNIANALVLGARATLSF
jgi:porin